MVPPPVCAAAGPSPGRRRQHLGEHLVLRPESLRPAVGHHQNEVDRGERARAVRDHDDDAPAGPGREDRLGQGLLPLGVEVRVRLVEHDQEGIAVERARKRNALALAGGERLARLADLRLVAVRQAQDEIVDVGGLGGGQDRLRIGPGIEAADVLGDRAREQLHILREVADVRSKILRIPLLEGGTVEADLAPHRRPDADEHAGERGLARCARTDHAEAVAGFEREGDVLHDEALCSGRSCAHALDAERRARAWQLQRRVPRGQCRHELDQPLPALAGGDEAAPVGDRELDRRQSARGQDRAGDDHAGRRLLLDDEIGADAKHRRLQRQAQHLGQRPETAGDVGGAQLRVEELGVR